MDSKKKIRKFIDEMLDRASEEQLRTLWYFLRSFMGNREGGDA